MNSSVARVFGTLSALALLAVPGFSQAQFLGETIELAHVYPNKDGLFTGLGLPGNFIVNAGIELPGYGSVIDFDISNTSISLSIAAGTSISSGDGSASSFSGYRFTDAFSTIPSILSVTINPLTDLAGFDATRVSFDADRVFLNLEGLATGSANRAVVVDVVFAPVPEVGTASLMILGLLSGVVARHKQRRRYS